MSRPSARSGVPAEPSGRPGRSQLVPLAALTTLWSFGVAISDPFLDAYLWSLGSSWTAIGLFNLAQYLAMALAFPGAGWLAKRLDRRLPLRLAALAVAGAFGLILYLGPRAGRHVFVLGLLLGVGWALYWLAQFVYSFDLTAEARRDRWQAVAGMLSTAAALAAPLLAAAVVGTAARAVGFQRLFAAALAFLAAVLVGTGFLAGGATRGPYRLSAALPRSRGPWVYILTAHLALAARDGVYLFAPALLVFSLSGSVVNLGAYLTVTQLISLAAYSFNARWGKPRLRRPTLLAGSAASTFAGLLLLLPLGVPLAWLFGAAAAALRPLLSVPVEACTLDVIGLEPRAETVRIEFTVVKEVAVNGARVLGIAVMVLAVAHAGADAVRWWLMAAAAAPWLAWLSLRRFPAVTGGG